MKILVGKTFGIGNCILTVPLLKALKSMGHEIDVLVGSLPDDGGAVNVLQHLVANGIIGTLHLNKATDTQYDVAIMAIPFDGRWIDGVHFFAKTVLDGRPRPIPSTTGLVSWEKHEVEYMMENAYKLGYKGKIPNCSFYGNDGYCGCNSCVYIGVGYKKDANGFWKVKHWGNDNYANLIKKLLDYDEEVLVYSTGDISDWNYSLKEIKEKVDNERFIVTLDGLDKSFKWVKTCGVYMGNDSGFMHVAASMGLKCITPFFLENSIVKNSPWGAPAINFDGTKEEVTVDKMFNAYVNICNTSSDFGEF